MPIFWRLRSVPRKYTELLSVENSVLFLHKHLTKGESGLIMKV